MPDTTEDSSETSDIDYFSNKVVAAGILIGLLLGGASGQPGTIVGSSIGGIIGVAIWKRAYVGAKRLYASASSSSPSPSSS